MSQPPSAPEVTAARPQRKPSEWSARPTPTPGVGRSTEDPRTPRLSELAQRAQWAQLTGVGPPHRPPRPTRPSPCRVARAAVGGGR